MCRPESLDAILSRELRGVQLAIRDDLGLAEDNAIDNFWMDRGELQANLRQERWQRELLNAHAAFQIPQLMPETSDDFDFEEEDWLWETDPLVEAASAAQLALPETEEQRPEVEHIEYRDGEPSNSEPPNDQLQTVLRQPNEDTPPHLTDEISLDALSRHYSAEATSDSDSESRGNELIEPTPGVPESEPTSEFESESESGPGSEPRQPENGSSFPESESQQVEHERTCLETAEPKPQQVEHGGSCPEPQPQEGNSGYNQL